ncbi:MAG: NAD(P)-dependent oxidoreductase [Eubacteriales bacterium]|nr:NAD(P)-dependent oxidoreductase [Eubacteriales bacterium]
MAKILITHGVPMEHFAMLKPNELVYPEPGKAFSKTELLALLPECDAVVACGAMDRRLLAACTKVKLIVCYGAGYDAINLDAATELRIPVANIPDSVTETTAEMAMTQLLTLLRRAGELDRQIRGLPSTRKLFTMGRSMGVSPQGLTLGIVGMGRIGSRVAEFGRFLHMRVIYASRSMKPYSIAGNARRLPLTELLKTADVVSLHCPLTAETNRMIDAEALKLMKPTAFLLNTARGKLVDERALAEALEKGELAGAALDVFEDEPEVSAKLKALPNVLMTPHIGSNTLYTRNQMADACRERIEDALAGRKPANLLNPEVWPGK